MRIKQLTASQILEENPDLKATINSMSQIPLTPQIGAIIGYILEDNSFGVSDLKQEDTENQKIILGTISIPFEKIVSGKVRVVLFE